MKTVTIKQGAMLPGTPHQVFGLLMDSKKHAAFTGDEASISRKVGGSFSTFGGWAEGKNIELVPDMKIVQSWRASDWPAVHISIVTITLLPAKGGQTKLMFSQVEVPAAHAKSIAQGWRDYYWTPMKKMLAEA